MPRTGWQIYKMARKVRSLKINAQREIWRVYPTFLLDSETRCLKKQLSRREFTLLLSPWYQDFKVLGFHSRQRMGMYKPSQECKQGPFFNIIGRAISLCREKKSPARGIELFCAEGFYSNHAVSRGAATMHGTDRDAYDLSKARRDYGQRGEERSGSFTVRLCASALLRTSSPAWT